MATKPKRKGQHTVHAILRVYSSEGALAARRLAEGPAEKNTKVRMVSTMSGLPTYFNLYEVTWMPRPSKNEHNTESDWRRKIARTFAGLYVDVVLVEYHWKEVN